MPRHTSPRRGSQTGSISTQTEFSAYSYNGRQLRPCPDDTSLSALRASMNMEAHTPGEGDRPTRRRRVIKRVVLACALCRARKIRCSGKPADDAEDIRCERCIVNDSTRRRGSQAAKASQRLHGRSPIASREQGQQGDGNTSDHTLSFSSPSDLYGNPGGTADNTDEQCVAAAAHALLQLYEDNTNSERRPSVTRRSATEGTRGSDFHF